ncbi:extracellular mutant protein 11-domain-containing protein [Biscogniauxia sp. FL1348]|nr:extracellular mutant protein 11-domain-containing protein [Biscogniauxia sp. FL1348]
MPPSHLRQSKTKMQAWVTNNGINSGGQTVSSGYDGALMPPNRHLYPQPAPPPRETSPTRPLPPTIDPNTNRSAAAMAARLPVPAHSSQPRDTSLAVPLPRGRPSSSDPSQNGRGQAPFWEGSTIDGSIFSDTASNVDTSTSITARPYTQSQPPPYPPQEVLLPRPTQTGRTAPGQRQHIPFAMGSNGIVNIPGNSHTRRASSLDIRSQRDNFKAAPPEVPEPEPELELEPEPEPEPEESSEDSQYPTSPDRTPSGKRVNRAKALTMRTNRRDSLTRKLAFSPGMSGVSPQKHQVHGEREDAREEGRLERTVFIRARPQDIRRPVSFPEPRASLPSQPSESEAESLAQQPTPKPVIKSKPQVNRQLFNTSKAGRSRSRESVVRHQHQPPVAKHHTSSKKRQYDLDYDDGVLSSMNYAELKKEEFDFDPAQAEAQSVVQPLRGTLPERLNHFRDKDQQSQMDLFTNMPVKEWEDAGDWFLDRFGDVMGKLRAARRNKRAVMEQFENEIAEREEAVRNKINTIGQTLTDLKSEGEGMMSRKTFD